MKEFQLTELCFPWWQIPFLPRNSGYVQRTFIFHLKSNQKLYLLYLACFKNFYWKWFRNLEAWVSPSNSAHILFTFSKFQLRVIPGPIFNPIRHSVIAITINTPPLLIYRLYRDFLHCCNPCFDFSDHHNLPKNCGSVSLPIQLLFLNWVSYDWCYTHNCKTILHQCHHHPDYSTLNFIPQSTTF